MRICSECKEEYKDYGQRCSLCRKCKRIYDREFHKNRDKEQLERKLQLQKIRIVENRKKLYQYLLKHPCSICNESRVACLHFHHINPDNKKFTISCNMGKSWENIKKEIDKCIVLCANCHAIETAKQLNYYTDIVQW